MVARVRVLLATLVVALCLAALPAPPASAQGPSGTVYAWGSNDGGQLGDGTTTDRTLPVQMLLPTGSAVTEVAGGSFHTLALTSDGRVLGWGENSVGQLGDGTTTSSLTGTQALMPAGLTATGVAAGLMFGVALASDGRVYAWGIGGQLGDGTTTDRTSPVEVLLPAGLTFTEVAAGAEHGLALASDGRVFTWGRNRSGQLGDGTTTDALTPVEVDLPAGVTVTHLAGGISSSFALTSDGRILAWGSNASGVLGDGTTTNHLTPVETVRPDGVIFTDVEGSTHALATTSDGRVFGWGANQFGQVGDGTTTDRLTPVEVAFPAGTPAITDVKASVRGHSMALSSDGRVFTWGLNRSGQLGDGTTVNRPTPYQVAFPGNAAISAIGIGYESSYALVEAPVSSTTTLTAWPGETYVGTPIDLTAFVTCTSGTATGEVTFLRDGQAVGTGTLDGSGTARLTTGRLEAGTYVFTARYEGDGTCPPSESAPVTVTVVKSPSRLENSADPVFSLRGDVVTFTAKVTCAVTPTGTVEFVKDGTVIGTADIGADGTAVFSTDQLPIGTYDVTAHYAGDANCAEAAPEQARVSVDPRATSTELTASETTVAPGDPVTLTARVTCEGRTPTGEVVFSANGDQLGTGTLDGAGQAVLVTSELPLGANVITAHYQGDALCPASDSEMVVVVVEEAPHPSLDLTKRVVSSGGPYTIGSTVDYAYTVTNTGNVELTGLTVSDDRVTSVTCDSTALAVGASTECRGSHEVTRADSEPCVPVEGGCALTNLAQATAFEPSGAEVASEQATATVAVAEPVEGLTLAKRADGQGPFKVGDTVSYTYTVSNTGNAALSGLTVTDDRVTGVFCRGTTVTPFLSVTCTGSHVITRADVEPCEPVEGGCALTNLAQATAKAVDGKEIVSEQATATVTVVRPQPGLTLAKSVVSQGPFRVGDTVAYAYTVTNSGNTELTDVTVTDDKVAAVTCDVTTLAPGASTTCSGSHDITAADINPCRPVTGGCALTNLAHATALAPDAQETVGGQATATITVQQEQPPVSGLRLAKRVVTEGPFEVGDTVEYAYTVTNTGDTELADVTVTDDKIATVTCDSATLAAGASTTCSGSHTIAAADLQDCEGTGHGYGKGNGNGNGKGNGYDGGGEVCSVTNTATAKATGPSDQQVVSDPARATISVNKEEAKRTEKKTAKKNS
ncbi:Ig-like domain repeat protein [Streptomyces laurentii]|uniref:RCC1 domain-containing protein n=1 Tax=Streptomyces laurentii TaxID=39478 RepID=UPI00369DD145